MVLRFSINYFVFFAAMATIVPYLQQILKIKGFQAHEIGFLLGLFEVTGVLGPLLVGWFADKVGKYRIVLLFLTVTAGVSFFFLSYRVGFAAASIILVFFGFMYRPIASLTDALASRTLTNTVTQYGKARIWGSIGYVGISFFYQAWGYLDSTDSFRIVLVFSILMGILFFSSMSLPKVPKSNISAAVRKKSIKGEKNNIQKILLSMPKIFWIGIGAAFLIKLSMSGYYSFFSIYLTDVYNLKGISGVWGLGALAEIPVILWGSRYIVKYGIGRMIALAALGTVLRMIIYAAVPPFPVMLAAQLLHALSFGLLHISIIVLISHNIPEETRALAMAIFGGISYGLAGFIGSNLSGVILEYQGFTVMYLFCASVSLVSVFLIFYFRHEFSNSSSNLFDNYIKQD